METEKISKFPRINVIYVIFLSYITFSFYIFFWLKKYSNILNKELSDKKISNIWFPLSITVTIINFVMIFIEIFTNDNPQIVLIGKQINTIYIIILILWLFKVRDKMNIVLETEKNTQYWYSGILTFFFNIWYLQYKTNRIQDFINNEQDKS
jgi:L-asparagine transporter-like permease